MATVPSARSGVCTPSGWAPSGVGPNCSFVGSRSWRGSILVGSCARNVRTVLERHSRAWIESLLSSVDGAAGALIFEDEQRAGDVDGTRAALRAWASADARVRLLLAAPMLYPRWSRTQRLALCRNMLAREAIRLPPNGVFVALDLDCRAPPALHVASVISSTLLPSAWDVLTVNTRAPAFYYDRWALRSTVLTLDYDCWFNATERRARGACPDYAITIDADAPPFAVDSAFNGLGLYRAAALRTAVDADCRYRGTKNSYLCEHVPFHMCMRQLKLAIGVLPSLGVDCGATTVSPAPRRRRIRLLSNGSVVVQAPPKVDPATTALPGARSRRSAKRKTKVASSRAIT